MIPEVFKLGIVISYKWYGFGVERLGFVVGLNSMSAFWLILMPEHRTFCLEIQLVNSQIQHQSATFISAALIKNRK